MNSIDILTSDRGLAIGPRYVTISTVGLPSAIIRLAHDERPFNLAVSLHAATDGERNALVPVSRRWPLVDLMDACRSMIYTTCRAVEADIDASRVRRMISEAKKFVTEACQKVAANAMQVMGGIAYTNVYPVERIVRDLRLASIWTGSNEVMSLITAHEWYSEYFQMKQSKLTRDLEDDAAEADALDEKIYE